MRIDKLSRLLAALLLVGLMPCARAQTTRSPEGRRTLTAKTVFLSKQPGIHGDSDVQDGGGTNDTEAVKAVFARAAGTGAEVVVDCACLISDTILYAPPLTVRCLTPSCGFYLADNSNKTMFRNAHATRNPKSVTDHQFVWTDGTLNQNVAHNRGGINGSQEANLSIITPLALYGVDDARIEGLRILNQVSYGLHIANCRHITLNNLTIDCGAQHYLNQDGVHLNGPIENLKANDLSIKSWDDAFAINANDATSDALLQSPQNGMGPYVGVGDITDVEIHNLKLVDNLDGIRIMSRANRIDRVLIDGYTGTFHQYALICDNGTPRPTSNVGSVTIANVDLTPLNAVPGVGDQRFAMFLLNTNVESLTLRNVKVKDIPDGRPLFWLYGGSAIGQFTLDGFTYLDTRRAATSSLFKFENGSRVKKATLRNVRWQQTHSGTNTFFGVANGGRASIDSLDISGYHGPHAATRLVPPRGLQVTRQSGDAFGIVGGPLLPGAIKVTEENDNMAVLTAAPKGGTPPYRFTLYRGATPDFSPNARSRVEEQDSFVFKIGGLAPNATTYFRYSVTDSANVIAYSPSVALSPSSVIYHKSTFTAPNDTDLRNYAPDYPPTARWTTTGPNPLGIEDGEVRVSANVIALVDTGHANGTVTAHMSSTTPNAISQLVCRDEGTGDSRIYVNFSYQDNSVVVHDFVKGKDTIFTLNSVPLPINVVHLMEVTLNNQALTVKVDGKVAGTASVNSHHDATRHGFSSGIAETRLTDWKFGE